MKTKLKIDKLSLSTPKRLSNVYYPYKNLPGYKSSKHVKSEADTAELVKKTKDYNIVKYKKIIQYKHTETGSSLIVCHRRKKDFKNISPIYIIFYTDYFHKITYPAVIEIERFFKQLNIPLRVSIIHLALDLISKDKIGLYKKIILAVKPGSKREPTRVCENGVYIGKYKSSNQLLIYDKGEELRKEGINVKEDICRIELRMRMHQMNNFIQTIDDLAVYDWSSVYPKYYSFHFRTNELKKKIKPIGEDWRSPIWELRDIMEDEYDMNPSNFYRDCLIDHPQLSISIPKALKRYRWKNDVSKS